MDRKWVVCAVLACMASAAQAADWIDVAHGTNSVLAVDRQSIVRKGSTVKVWVKTVYNPPYPTYDGKYEGSKVSRWGFDCSARTSSTGAVTIYSLGGEVLRSVNFNINAYDDVAPETVGESVMRAVCGSRSD